MDLYIVYKLFFLNDLYPPYEVVYECIENKEGSKEYSKCMKELLLIDEIYLKKQKLENQLLNKHSIFLENKISLLNEKLKRL